VPHGQLVGLALVVPRPRITRYAVATALSHLVRRLAAPAVAGTVVVVCAHVDAAIPVPARLALLVSWYTALALAAAQCCRLVARLGTTVAEPPRPDRLRAGLWTLTVAGTVAGLGIGTAGLSGGSFDPVCAALGVGLLVLACTAVGTIRDLGQLPDPPAISSPDPGGGPDALLRERPPGCRWTGRAHRRKGSALRPTPATGRVSPRPLVRQR
jgi:hypothetical protein